MPGIVTEAKKNKNIFSDIQRSMLERYRSMFGKDYKPGQRKSSRTTSSKPEEELNGDAFIKKHAKKMGLLGGKKHTLRKKANKRKTKKNNRK